MAVRRLAAAIRGRSPPNWRPSRPTSSGCRRCGRAARGRIGQRRRAARPAAGHALGVGALAGTGAVAAQGRRLVVDLRMRQRRAVAVAGRRGRARRPARAVVRRARRAAGAARGRSTPRRGGCRSSRRSSARSRGGRGCGARRCGRWRRSSRPIRRTTGLPPVVTGDLNAVPESDEVRLLEGFLTEPAVPDLLLVDAWRYAEPSDRGITWSRANPHAAKTGEPDARIDYVLVGTPRGAGSALVTGGAGGGGSAAGRGVAVGPCGGGGGPAARWSRVRRAGGRLRVGGPRSAGSRSRGSRGGRAGRRRSEGADEARHCDGLSCREVTSRSSPVPDDDETGAVGGGEVGAVGGPADGVDGAGVAGAA